jgi:acyl-CoA synthetase (AMP-forming)/AMP-acid ligase II
MASREVFDNAPTIEDPKVSIIQGPALENEPDIGPLTLPGFLHDVSDRFASREAIVHRHPHGRVERWSYAELRSRSEAVAKALVACGLGKGEHVGVLMTNRPEFLSSVFGITLAGGVAVPLSTFSTPSELEHLIATSACSILLLEPRVLKKDFTAMLCELEPAIGRAGTGGLASLPFPFLRHVAMIDEADQIGRIEPWDRFLARGQAISDASLLARAATVQPADPGVIFFSSGSTNKPKAILSSHRGVSIQLWRMRRQQALADAVRTWTANGFFWSGNFAMVLGATLAAGGTLILQRTFQVEEAIDLITSEKASFLFAWPHQWAQLESTPKWASADLSSLQHVDKDGPIARHPTVKTEWTEPRHCYGNTETFTLSTGYPANTLPLDAGDSHGVPLPGNRIKIVDPLTGKTQPLGERGEIAVKGPTLMMGYLGIPIDMTLDAEGYFRTGDGGFVDPMGRLFWEGRLNDLIKTGGANVSPVEIDDVIRSHPGVKLAQTVGIPDDNLGELVVTCIVPADNSLLTVQEIRSFAKERLASYKVPRRVVFLRETDLDMTGTSKVKTDALRERVTKILAN